MKKLTAVLIASLFATVAYAQAPAATTPAPAAAPKVHKHKVKHHKTTVEPAKAAPGA